MMHQAPINIHGGSSPGAKSETILSVDPARITKPLTDKMRTKRTLDLCASVFLDVTMDKIIKPNKNSITHELMFVGSHTAMAETQRA